MMVFFRTTNCSSAIVASLTSLSRSFDIGEWNILLTTTMKSYYHVKPEKSVSILLVTSILI